MTRSVGRAAGARRPDVMSDVSPCGGCSGVCTFSWGDVNNSGNCTTICDGEESRFAFECHYRP